MPNKDKYSYEHVLPAFELSFFSSVTSASFVSLPFFILFPSEGSIIHGGPT